MCGSSLIVRKLVSKTQLKPVGIHFQFFLYIFLMKDKVNNVSKVLFLGKYKNKVSSEFQPSGSA